MPEGEEGCGLSTCTVSGGGGSGLDADEFRQGLAFDQEFYFAGVQNFALEQGLRDADQNFAIAWSGYSWPARSPW